MDGLKRRTLRTAEIDAEEHGSTAHAPAYISDILYLMAAQHADVLKSKTAQKLGQANIGFIRGDLRSARTAAQSVLDDVDCSHEAYGDIFALRLFLEYMIDHRAGLRMAESVPHSLVESRPVRIVTLCIESDKHWHSGSLFKGLLANRSAIQQANGRAPAWLLYAHMLLAKKLTDIHVSHQVSRVVADMQDLMRSAGLHAFETLVEGLRSVLHLQNGHADKALESASASLRAADQRATPVAVKLSLSVAATAHLGRRDRESALTCLSAFHSQPAHYALPDSLARVAFAEAALAAADEGPRAAADRIRESWPLLGTESACFVEDVTRPAWLVDIARRAGDSALAERSMAAIERLAAKNPEVSILRTAADHARAAFTDQPWPPSVLDLAGCHRPPDRSPHPLSAPAPRTSDDGAREPLAPVLFLPSNPLSHARRPASRPAAVDTDADGEAAPEQQARLPALSHREEEIARLVGRGMTNKQVAHQLGLSPHTVNFHLRSIFRKLSISTRVKLGRIIAQIDRQQDTAVTPDQPR